jgi:hypothetical protein
MNLLNFTTMYTDEASCKARWKEYQDKQGVMFLTKIRSGITLSNHKKIIFVLVLYHHP